jgi:hypothetical protein
MHTLSLLEIGIIGFLAQMVDGALGMGYGVTSSSLLISLGIYPVIASASIHTAEVFVSFVSGITHFKLGNTRKDLLFPLISFGIIGGILGACGLVRLPPRPTKLAVASVLLVMGSIIFYRFMFMHKKINTKIKVYSVNKLRALGFFAAFIDAIGGGGWGPICTPTLIIKGTEPDKAIGSVNLAEFFVTLAMSLTFLALIRFEKFRWDIVFSLLIGGIIAAPLAAYGCKKLPRRLLGVLVGLTVILLSLKIFQK